MNKLCRQVSIESPGITMKDCACYRMRRSPSISSISSTSSVTSDLHESSSPAHHGVRDGALFPGYEVAGIVDQLGCDLSPNCDVKVGQRVVLYPYDGIPHGYAEYIVVPDLKYLVPIPECLSLSVAAMLPTGALLAKNAVFTAQEYVQKLLDEIPDKNVCKILIVGTGGLALWAMRIAAHHFSSSECRNKVKITVASLRDEGFLLAKEFQKVNVVQWTEALYEKQLIERTVDACDGLVDIVIDFGTTSRSLHRSLQCLNKGGVVLVSEEVADRLLPKFSKRAEERQQHIRAVANGSVEQLASLVQTVASGEIEPPPHTVFPADQACEVVRKLCQSEIPGRAILRFHDVE
ncbi:Death resistor Adh domain containing target [Carabus blaptoides fortunei]